MTQQVINTGTAPNDGLGDPIRTAFIKTNTNFTQLFALPNPSIPANLLGKTGDLPGMYAYDANYFYYCFATYDGTNTIWSKVPQVNSISVANIVNGTSSVRIASANANITIGVNGTSNVAVFSNVGISLPGNIRSGNVFANYFYPNGLPFTAGGDYSNANVTALLPVYTGNITAEKISTTGNVYIGGQVSTAGDVVGANFKTPGIVSAIGIQAGIISVSGNIKTSGILTNNYYYANGTPFAGGGGGGTNYTNANVAAYLPTYTGAIGSPASSLYVNQITAVGIVTTGGADSNISGANVISANVFSATGNVYSNYIFGNGSQLTGLPAGYTDANVANYLPTYTGGFASLTGNVNTAGGISTTGDIATAGYFRGNFQGNVTGNVTVAGSNTQVLFNNTGNIGAAGGLTFDTNGPNLLTVLGTITATGNIYGNNIVGSLTGTATSAATVTAAAQPNVTSVGTLTSLTISGNLATANLSVTGSAFIPPFTTTGSGAADITGANLIVTSSLSATGNVTLGNLFVTTSRSPASTATYGTPGQMAWDTNYIYVCVAPNTWKRSPLTGGY